MNTDTTPVEGAEETVDVKKLNLTLDVKKIGACQRRVTVSVPREDIERYFEKHFNDLVPKAEIPGFRAGKAPRKLIENKFRKQVADQVKGALLMDSLAQVNDESHFSAISEPDLDYEQVQIPDSGPLTYEFQIEVRPEFDLPNWKGMKIKRPEHTFTEQEIKDYQFSLAKRRVDFVPVEGTIQAEDLIVVNLRASCEGVELPVIEETEINVLPILTFNDGVIENFGELVIGKKAGDQVNVQVKVSDYAENVIYQGKTLDVVFEILDVKRPDLPEQSKLHEQFDFETAEEFDKAVGEALKRQLEYEQHQQVRDQISKLLTESATWELPPDLLKRQFRRELSRALMGLRSSGFSPEEIRARENLLRQDSLNRTEVLLKEHFILERIAEDLKIEDEPLDYDLEIARIAASSNESPRRVRARLEKTGQIDALRNLIIERKVVEMIEKEAIFEPTPHKLNPKQQAEALNFSLSGSTETDIPEAKFDEQPEKAIPGMANAGNKTSAGNKPS